MSAAIHQLQGRFGRAELLCVEREAPGHTHAQLHILLKASGADGLYTVGGDTAPLEDDSAVLVDPWIPHARRTGPTENAPTLLLALYVEPSWIGAPPCSLAGAGPPIFTGCHAALSPRAREARDRLIAGMQGDPQAAPDAANEPAAGTVQEAPLLELLDQLLADCARCNDAPARLPTCRPATDQRIRRAIVMMRHRINKVPGIDGIASAAGLSRSRFYECFQDTVGLTPRTYADTLMIEEAVRRLTEEDWPIADLAAALGFSAQGHFTRFFRNKTGLTPSRYRRLALGNLKRRLIAFERSLPLP